MGILRKSPREIKEVSFATICTKGRPAVEMHAAGWADGREGVTAVMEMKGSMKHIMFLVEQLAAAAVKKSGEQDGSVAEAAAIMAVMMSMKKAGPKGYELAREYMFGREETLEEAIKLGLTPKEAAARLKKRGEGEG